MKKQDEINKVVYNCFIVKKKGRTIKMKKVVVAFFVAFVACAIVFTVVAVNNANKTVAEETIEETDHIETWPIEKFQGQWFISGDFVYKNTSLARTDYKQIIKTFRKEDGVLRLQVSCIKEVEIRTDADNESDAYAEADDYLLVLHVPKE